MDITMTKKVEPTVSLLNPMISSVLRIFRFLLDFTPRRVRFEFKQSAYSQFPVSAIAGITGVMNGTIVFRVSESVACGILQSLLSEEVTEITSEVCDAVGEVANMIAGLAKSELSHLKLSIGIPNMILGEEHRVYYSAEIEAPMCLHFESEMGPFMVEFGFQN